MTTDIYRKHINTGIIGLPANMPAAQEQACLYLRHNETALKDAGLSNPIAVMYTQYGHHRYAICNKGSENKVRLPSFATKWGATTPSTCSAP